LKIRDRDRHTIFWLVLVITLQITTYSNASENPKNRIDYWQNTYDELLPKDDPRAARAHDIFQRVLNAAGSRPGVMPRLFIVKDDSPTIPLSFAIPDGGIIISKQALDICYQDPKLGDDRLAFILAHEIAHQLKDDFWHMKFFQAIELSRDKNSQDNETLKEVQAFANLTDKVIAKELQADEEGIIYASMAGFNTSAIVSEDDKVNFFECFYQSLDPSQIKSITQDPNYPTPKQRAETVKARLKQVLDKVDLFNLGLLFYQTGDYPKAINFFAEFLRFFPSREVYHNLASSHHQLALKYYQEWKGDELGIPFKLSLAVDPLTRASEITLRGSKNPEELCNEHLEKAIKYYQIAISQDPFYFLAYNNLACALIMKGEVYKAIGTLEDTLKLNPSSPETLNNLGVAFYYAENLDKAKEHIIKANKLDSEYDAPLFNLGKIAYEEKKETETKKYWMSYLKLDPASPWAELICKTLKLDQPQKSVRPSSTEKEKILGVAAGAYEEDMPSNWKKPCRTKNISLEDAPYELSIYENGLMTISQDGQIQLIATLGWSKQKSTKGISIGSLKKDLQNTYGSPSKVQNLTQGENWIYETPRISFQLRSEGVISFLLFLE